MMTRVVRLVSLLLILAAGRAGAASESEPPGPSSIGRLSAGAGLAKENAELRQRVEKLEGEVEELKKTASVGLKGGTPSPHEKSATRLPVWSSLDIQLYGYLKLDAAYDTSRINNGNYAQWVEREDMNRNDDQFNMTANETRLGMLISGPDNSRVKTSGRVEVDFFEGGAENKARLMMRHAYIKLDWPAERFNIIAGQTSDVISPLLPSTVNYSVGWWVGNIGYRRPQFRLTKELGLDTDVDVKFEAALARTIGRTDAIVGTESGEDAGFPSLQARASVTLPVLGPDRSTFGVSGHWGK